MEALTIQNPYPHLIVTPQAELPEWAIQKRVENRTWEFKKRGLFLIHAGVSMAWFKCGDYPVPEGKLRPEVFPEMAFGAIVGIMKVVDCLHINQIRSGEIPKDLSWLKTHAHVSGPWCLVLGHVCRLEKPVPLKGAQGLWKVPAEVVDIVANAKLIEVPFHGTTSQKAVAQS